MAITIVEELWSRIRTHIDDKIVAAESAADRAEAAAQSTETGVQPDTVGRLHLTPELRGEIDGKAPSTHTHTASQISDATTVGSNVLKASSQAAARTAIGAGTSNLTLGTTASTAAAGDHTHTMSQITDLPVITPNDTASAIVRRWSNAQITVPLAPLNNGHAASKSYVDNRAPAPIRQEVQGSNGVTTFEKTGNIVYVISTGNSGGITIPAGFRPTQTRRIAVPSGNSSIDVGVCTINTDGSISGGWGRDACFSYMI